MDEYNFKNKTNGLIEVIKETENNNSQSNQEVIATIQANDKQYVERIIQQTYSKIKTKILTPIGLGSIGAICSTVAEEITNRGELNYLTAGCLLTGIGISMYKAIKGNNDEERKLEKKIKWYSKRVKKITKGETNE